MQIHQRVVRVAAAAGVTVFMAMGATGPAYAHGSGSEWGAHGGDYAKPGEDRSDTRDSDGKPWHKRHCEEAEHPHGAWKPEKEGDDQGADEEGADAQGAESDKAAEGAESVEPGAHPEHVNCPDDEDEGHDGGQWHKGEHGKKPCNCRDDEDEGHDDGHWHKGEHGKKPCNKDHDKPDEVSVPPTTGTPGEGPEEQTGEQPSPPVVEEESDEGSMPATDDHQKAEEQPVSMPDDEASPSEGNQVMGAEAEAPAAKGAPPDAAPASAVLPATGAGRYGIPIAGGLVLLGAGGVLIARRRHAASR